MNETAIWEKACGLLRDEMSEPSFDTWIAPLAALKYHGDALYVDTTSDFIKKHILMRYSLLIASAVSQAAGRSTRVEFVTPQEAQALFPKTEAAEAASFSLNPKYTFDTFVVGNSTALRARRRWLWQRRRQRRITRCLSMVASALARRI